MAQEGSLERCSDKCLKIQAVIRGFVGSLCEILDEEDLFENEADVLGSVLCQTEAELKNRLKQLKLKTDTAAAIVASASEPGDNLATARLHSKRATKRCADPESEVGVCRHFCKDHPELLDISLWETLPAEVVDRICARLPVSKILELLGSCNSQTATNLRQLCAEARDDLFGILMLCENFWLHPFRLAIYDPKHQEWFHLQFESMPIDYEKHFEGSELVFGHGGGLICVAAHAFPPLLRKAPPRILAFNPLTGDTKYIGVSSFTASGHKMGMRAVLLQLIMDEERQCYKLILVTERIMLSTGGYHSESYDSMSGLWSTLDSGFVHGDGVFGMKRYHVCFDCRLKKFFTPAEYGKSVTNPHSHVYLTNFRSNDTYDPFCTSVRDHRFEVKYVQVETDDEILSFTAEISESVWQNGWHEKSIVELEMDIPCERCETRLLACTRYVLVLADDGRFADSEDTRQHMALYDRVTCKELHRIPQFMNGEFRNDEYLMTRNLPLMCDLKWDALP